MKADKTMMLALLKENRKAQEQINSHYEQIAINEDEILKEIASELGLNWMDLELTLYQSCDDP